MIPESFLEQKGKTREQAPGPTMRHLRKRGWTGLVKGLGLVLNDLGKESKKWGLDLTWMLSGSRVELQWVA